MLICVDVFLGAQPNFFIVCAQVAPQQVCKTKKCTETGAYKKVQQNRRVQKTAPKQGETRLTCKSLPRSPPAATGPLAEQERQLAPRTIHVGRNRGVPGPRTGTPARARDPFSLGWGENQKSHSQSVHNF